MIIGMGIDIVEIKRIEKVYRNFPQRFIQKILTPLEQNKLNQHSDPIRFLAKRFAVKESASKALGTGFRQGVCWHDIIVEHSTLGQPQLKFLGCAEKISRRLGVTHSWISLSDEKSYVVAQTLLEKN